MADSKDRIYQQDQPQVAFEFDERVADVFSDMINRSVPGYGTIISMIGTLAERYVQQDSNAYDLGCSLGAATLAMRRHLQDSDRDRGVRIIAVDNSAAMVERCRQRLAAENGSVPVDLVQGDVLETDISNASMVVLNFTLQFIPLARRPALLETIYRGMRPGGLLVLSEKVRFEDPDLDELFIDLHHHFKIRQGYSELEVSRKRAALENVLIPETIAAHEARIGQAGFSSFDVWFQCFNFASMVAVKA